MEDKLEKNCHIGGTIGGALGFGSIGVPLGSIIGVTKGDEIKEWWSKQWDEHEWQNQYKHWMTGNILFLIGLGQLATYLGMGEEVHQFFGKDEYDLKLFDRIRDITFYSIGGAGMPVPLWKMNEPGPKPWEWPELEGLI